MKNNFCLKSFSLLNKMIPKETIIVSKIPPSMRRTISPNKPYKNRKKPLWFPTLRP